MSRPATPPPRKGRHGRAEVIEPALARGPDAAGDQRHEGDDLDRVHEHAAAAGADGEQHGVDDDRGDRQARDGGAAVEPGGDVAGGAAPCRLDGDERELREADRVEDRRDDRREPDDPPDEERRLDREDLLGEGVGAAGAGELRGDLREAQGGDDGDGAVEGEGEDRPGAGLGEGGAGEGEDAAADDGADADAGGAEEAEGALRRLLAPGARRVVGHVFLLNGRDCTGVAAPRARRTGSVSNGEASPGRLQEAPRHGVAGVV